MLAAAAAVFAAGAAQAQAANELVVWHAYRGAEKAAFEKMMKCSIEIFEKESKKK